MAKQYIDIGEDEPITITVLNADASAANLSLYDGYGVKLYYYDSGTEIEKYSSNVVSGWDNSSLDTTNEATGILVIDFQSAVSVLGSPDKDVYGQIVTQATDASYASSQFRNLGAPFYCFTFRQGGIVASEDMS